MTENFIGFKNRDFFIPWYTLKPVTGPCLHTTILNHIFYHSVLHLLSYFLIFYHSFSHVTLKK